MYAIVDIAGQQLKVEKDQKVFVHRLDVEEGKQVQFDRVLLIDDNGSVTLGAPAINGAQVSATVLEHLKGDKVIVFKKKRRKGHQKKNGHRQYLTWIKISDIVASGAKPAVKKAEASTPSPKVEKTAPVAVETPVVSNDLESKTVAELREMAKDKNIAGFSSMKKADLIAALS